MPPARRFRSTTSGPDARGREFGQAHAGIIAANLAGYQAMWEALRPGYDPREDGAAALTATAAFAPDLAAEMEGIAAGAGLEPRLVGALNARTEILARLGAQVPECSAVVALPDGGLPVMAQTWDWFGRFRDGWLVWEVVHEDRETHVLTEAGIVGKAGLSTRGLGLLFTILHHARDGGAVGVPVHVAARAALDAGTLEGALDLLGRAKVSASSSLTLASREGARSVELHPGGPGLVEPRGGLIVHTNHFLDPAAAVHETGLAGDSDTLARRDHLARLSRDASVRDVLRAMDDHASGVCCHPPPGTNPADEYATLATLTLDLAAGALHAHPGGPCTHPRRTA
jgi:isopenicillin-N N-acyltransferase-like protein